MPVTETSWYLFHFMLSSQEAVWSDGRRTRSGGSLLWHKCNWCFITASTQQKSLRSHAETHQATKRGELIAFINIPMLMDTQYKRPGRQLRQYPAVSFWPSLWLLQPKMTIPTCSLSTRANSDLSQLWDCWGKLGVITGVRSWQATL